MDRKEELKEEIILLEYEIDQVERLISDGEDILPEDIIEEYRQNLKELKMSLARLQCDKKNEE